MMAEDQLQELRNKLSAVSQIDRSTYLDYCMYVKGRYYSCSESVAVSWTICPWCPRTLEWCQLHHLCLPPSVVARLPETQKVTATSFFFHRQATRKATRAINEARQAKEANELLVGGATQGGGEQKRMRRSRACKEPLQR